MADRVDIMTIAAAVLQREREATPGPWRYGALEHGGRFVTDGAGYLFAQVDDDGNGRLIAAYRTAAPALARFVGLVDKALREAQEDADRSADSASHRDITFMLDGVRRRLGLEVP